MQSMQWQNRVRRVGVVPAAIALGAIATMGLRGQAVQQPNNPPLQPPVQALNIQSAFEQVADRLRPSVVFIKSRQTETNPTLRPGADEGDTSPFGFSFPGFPGQGGGPGQQFRTMPQTPHHAYASGSGVIVRGDGYILTNDHVVAGSDRVTVRLQDGREFVGKVKRDFRSDLALIKIDANNLPAADLGDSDKAKIGQWAIAFGSPFGLNDTMTVGVVSALHREQAIGQGSDGRFYSSLMQTDASINPGNSGGPLVDIYGRVVGINVAIESPSGGNVGIGFAIPANTARYIMDQLITKGSVTRGFLGLAPKTLAYDEQQRYGVKDGALVTSVEDGTPASKAGFQVEDVIRRFDGKAITDDASLRDMVAQTKPGDTVPVVVRRNGAEQTLHVTIGAAPEQTVAQNDVPSQPATSGKLGVSVANATDPDVRKQLNLPAGLSSGAVIVQVAPGSPAADAGLQAGDVIMRLNAKQIGNASELSAAASSLKDGSMVSVVVRRGKQQILTQLTLE